MRVRKVAKDGKMKAVVSITLDDEFVVHDIKVIEGEKGLFIAMPSRKASDGEYRDIAHPINSETRERIQTIILEQYEKSGCRVCRGGGSSRVVLKGNRSRKQRKEQEIPQKIAVMHICGIFLRVYT